MRPSSLAILLATFFLAALPSRTSHAQEETEDVDYADGVSEVAALERRNESELLLYSAGQPAPRYEYPRRKLVVDAPWGAFFQSFEKGTGSLLLATLLPHVGVTMIGTPQPTLAWPWSFPVGPKFSATREKKSFDVYVHRPLRLLFEPSLVVGDQVMFSLRPGLRFIHHPSRWPVGIGGGLGANVQLASKEGARVGLSPEAVVRLGPCCKPGYVTLAARPDIFFSGKDEFLFSAHVGFTYF